MSVQESPPDPVPRWCRLGLPPSRVPPPPQGSGGAGGGEGAAGAVAGAPSLPGNARRLQETLLLKPGQRAVCQMVQRGLSSRAIVATPLLCSSLGKFGTWR